MDPAKEEVLTIFKAAAPGLLRLAIKRAEGYTETVGKGEEAKTVTVPGDNNLLKELVKKALPDNLNLSAGENPFVLLIRKQAPDA